MNATPPLDPKLSRWQRKLAYWLCGAAIVLGCGTYYRQLWDGYASFNHDIDPVCRAQFCDFTYFYYKQAQAIRSRDTPIKKYYYSPAFALFLLPIAQLPFEDALVAWSWVQALSLVLLVVAGVWLLRPFPGWTHLLLLFLTLTSYPVLHNWKWGQANTTFMALIALALALAERGLSKWAALALSVVVASRYYPAIYALAFLARGRFRAALWSIAYVTLWLIALPALAMGAAHAWNFYVGSAASIEQAYGAIAKNPASQYLPSAALRLARMGNFSHVGSRELWIAAAALLAACNAATALWAGYRRAEHRTLWAFCFLALSTPLLAHTSWPHYFVYLPLVQTFLAGQLASSRAVVWLRIAGFLLAWLPSVVVSGVFYFLHVHDPKLYAQQGYLVSSNMVLLALAYGLSVSTWLRGSANAAASRPVQTGPEADGGNADQSQIAVTH